MAKFYLSSFIVLLFVQLSFSQGESDNNNLMYQLNVINGYGSGLYHPSDTIHIWAGEQPGNKIFVNWLGDTEFLANDNEWHTTLVMPTHEVNVTAEIVDLPANVKMITTNIKGAENVKRVTTYFPPKDKLKGVVWLWHGTNGFGINWNRIYDMFNYAKYLMFHNYAVVATDCEEQTLNMDLDGDGVYRYTYGIDTNLIDQANIRALRDTFIQRGYMDHQTLNFAAGFSAGGAFSEILPNIFNWQASYNQSSAGIEALSLQATKPYFHAISINDNHPDVGPEGVIQSIAYAKNYKDRGVCIDLELYKSQPLYPERFALDGTISVEKSRTVFEEIKANNWLNADNTLAFEPNYMVNQVMNNPSKFPNIISLSTNQREFVIDQMGVTYGYHIFKSEYNGRCLDFFETLCAAVGVNEIDHNSTSTIGMYPNPVSDVLYFRTYDGPYEVYSIQGKLQLRGNGSSIDLSVYNAGLYVIKTKMGMDKIVKI